jgi:hypothetical protein
MKNLPRHFATLLATAWAGGLWAIGYIAAPTLFNAQPDKQLAGMLAGQMFVAIGYVGMVCGVYLLAYRLAACGKSSLRDSVFLIAAAMLLISFAIQFEIQPLMAELKLKALPAEIMHSELASRFKNLHGLSSILYLIESLLGALLVIKLPQASSK